VFTGECCRFRSLIEKGTCSQTKQFSLGGLSTVHRATKWSIFTGSIVSTKTAETFTQATARPGPTLLSLVGPSMRGPLRHGSLCSNIHPSAYQPSPLSSKYFKYTYFRLDYPSTPLHCHDKYFSRSDSSGRATASLATAQPSPFEWARAEASRKRV